MKGEQDLEKAPLDLLRVSLLMNLMSLEVISDWIFPQLTELDSKLIKTMNIA